MTATDYDAQKFHDGLVAHGLIVPVGVQGVFGRGHVFEDVLERFNALVSEIARDDGAEYFVFPPVIDRKVLESSDYMDSFPHLAGTVFSFFGKELDARKLSERIHACEPWGDTQGMTDVVLNPAACYPVYPSFSGTVPAEGRLVTMLNWVYRHEPSPEPTRMQSFRVREFVRCGTPAQVVEWRNMWLERGVTLLKSLGLDAVSDVASDPFFGKGGKMLAVSQKEQQLKFEVLVPVISTEKPTAVCSFNFHQEHFGEAFHIKTADGAVANTACLGFGLERIVMALFQAHGFDPKAWPAEVRARLWP
ncbi:MAG: amino acid--[acyl-carrier-protein] ligase [Dokdonella sp.]|nr:amino acid--[acyl-carrier-protein] ligase [Xanthomonadales bacterium]